MAVSIYDCVASEPELRLAPVRVRVTDDQTAAAVSATRVPNEVRVRLLNDQIADGRVLDKLDEADKMLASVF